MYGRDRQLLKVLSAASQPPPTPSVVARQSCMCDVSTGRGDDSIGEAGERTKSVESLSRGHLGQVGALKGFLSFGMLRSRESRTPHKLNVRVAAGGAETSSVRLPGPGD